MNVRLGPAPLRAPLGGRGSDAAAVTALVTVIALVTGALVARMGPAVTVGLLVAPLLAGLILLRPSLSFLVFVGCAAAVPYYLAAGSQQAAAFRIEAAGVLAASLLGAVYTRRAARPTVVDWFVVAFVASTLASWLVFGGSIKTTINTLLPIAFYAGARAFSRERVWEILWIVLIGGAIGAVTVLYEGLVVGSAVFVSPDQYLWNANGQALFRPGGVFASPPGAVTVLTMAAICGMAVIARSRGAARWIAIALTLTCVGGAIDTFTRAGYIGFAAGAVVYVLLARSSVLTPRRFLVIAGVVVAIFTTLFLPALSSTTWFQQGVLRKGNLQIRESYWALAEPLITDSTTDFLVGHGVDGVVSQSSTGGPGAGISQGLATSPTLTSIGPHSEYVRLLLEQGVFGLLLVAGWIGGAALGAVARVRRIPNELRPAAAALVGATVSFALVASAGDSMRHPPSLAAIALVTGMLVTITPRRRSAARTEGAS